MTNHDRALGTWVQVAKPRLRLTSSNGVEENDLDNSKHVGQNKSRQVHQNVVTASNSAAEAIGSWLGKSDNTGWQ